MNQVQIIARVATTPTLRATSSGTNIATLRLAIPRPRKNGEDQGADYVDVVTFGRQAETCVEYLTKGRRVAVTGRLAHSEWTAEDGTHRSKIEVIANTVDFLDRPTTTDTEGHAAVVEAAA
jgi:single-strand DNA-binding protein